MGTKVLTPHPQYLVKLYAGVTLIFVIFIFPWIFLGLIPQLGWIYVLVFILANALWIIPTFLLLPAYYKSLRYEIGETEVTVYKGIFTRSVKTVPYRTITDFTLKRDILDRWFLNLGTLEVQTAGHSGQVGPESRLAGLKGWDELRAELLERLRAYRASAGTGAEMEPGPTLADSRELLRQILEELRGLRQDLQR